MSILNFFLIFLVLAVALLLIRNTANIYLSGNSKGPAVSKGKVTDKTAAVIKNIMNYSVVLEKNPFGPPMKLQPVNISEQKQDKPVSISGLLLLGTVVGPEKLSYAVFQDKTKPGSGHEVFGLGENVFNYGILYKIETSSVVLQSNSTSYTVTIPFEDLSAVSAAPTEQQAVQEEPAEGTFAKQVGEREYLIDRRKVEQSLENPEHILTDARLLPNFSDGKQEGFSISEVVPDGLYHSLGLQNGDVLLKINGLEISNPEVAIQAMSALRGMNRINLDIIRNGNNMSMNYQIR